LTSRPKIQVKSTSPVPGVVPIAPQGVPVVVADNTRIESPNSVVEKIELLDEALDNDADGCISLSCASLPHQKGPYS